MTHFRVFRFALCLFDSKFIFVIIRPWSAHIDVFFVYLQYDSRRI